MNIKGFLSRYFFDANDRKIAAILKQKRISRFSDRTLLVELFDDYTFIYRYYFLLPYLAETLGSRISWVNIRPPFGAGSPSFKTRLRHRLWYNFLSDRKFYNLHRKLGGNLIGSFPSVSVLTRRRMRKRARNILSGFATGSELVAYVHDGIRLGDLICDTYLRFKPSPRLDLQDPFLLEVISAALIIYEKCAHIFAANRISAVLTSHSTYIHHGILTRTALNKGVPVFACGSHMQLLKRISKENPIHTRDYYDYHAQFRKLGFSQRERDAGLKLLDQRVSGHQASQLTYMKVNTYEKARDEELLALEKKLEQGPSALIMAHDFFDSPHIYRSMLFTDFHEWLDFLLSRGTAAGVFMVVKPHPNGVPGNEEEMNKFRRKYPSVHFIKTNASNRQLAAMPFSAVFTAYGTVGHEFPYLGRIVVNAGDNPHINYGFCFHPDSKESLDWHLSNLSKLASSLNRDEIGEFVYMHFLSLTQGRIEADRSLYATFPHLDSSESLLRLLDQEDAARRHAEEHARLSVLATLG